MSLRHTTALGSYLRDLALYNHSREHLLLYDLHTSAITTTTCVDITITSRTGTSTVVAKYAFLDHELPKESVKLKRHLYVAYIYVIAFIPDTESIDVQQ